MAALTMSSIKLQHRGFCAILCIALLLACAGKKAGGQTLTFLASSSVQSVQVSNQVTISIDVTNLTGIPLANLAITDSLPSSVTISSVNPDVTFYAAYGNTATFSLSQFQYGQILQISLNVKPTVAGFLTNVITLYTPSLLTNSETNLVIAVTNQTIQANLGVSFHIPTVPVFTHDLTSYGITVTNAGPNATPDVMLTNTLPPGALLIGITPSSLAYSNSSGTLIFNLGTLGADSSTNLSVAIEPTSSGTLPTHASVGSFLVTNISYLNTQAQTNFTVLAFVSGVLEAFTNYGQVVDPQTGLEEQTILVTNLTSTNVPSARVFVIGLNNQLYNAAGTNNGNPFVYYPGPIPPGQTVQLLLQFNPRGAFVLTNGQLEAYPSPLPDLSPPSATGKNPALTLTGPFRLSNGGMLIEFPSTPGKSYTVVYSDNPEFTNAQVAPPSIVAPANVLQWVDYGPPTTKSVPTNSLERFYRVIAAP